MAGVPTELISAAIGALSGGGVSWAIHRQDVAQRHVQDVRDVLLKLLDLREQAENPRVNQELLNQRRIMLLAVADSLAARARKTLTTPDWLSLGEESALDRDFTSARRYYELGLASSRKGDTLTQVIALRHLAIYNYSAAPDGAPSEGGKFFKQAADLTRSSDDAYLRFVTGYTLATWAWYAEDRDDEHWRQLTDEAIECYRSCGPRYPPAADEAAKVEAWKEGLLQGQPEDQQAQPPRARDSQPARPDVARAAAPSS